MKELGEYLVQMREARGVTLETVAEATRINIVYLRALEEGNYDILPAEIYVRGFLISYAEFLGVDSNELLRRYESDRPKQKKRIFSIKEQPSVSSPKTPSREGETKEKKMSFSELWHSLKAIPAVAYIVALAVIVLGVVILISLKGEKAPETLAEAIVGDTTFQSVSFAPSDEDIAQHIRIVIDSVNAAQALSIAESLTFTIRAIQPVSMYIELDHVKKAFKGIMAAGEKKSWRAKNSIYIETSNPSLLRISVNGFDLNPMEIRHPQTLEINRQNVLQLIVGYQPPPPGVISSYGQRIESASKDTNTRPPSEARMIPARQSTTQTMEDTSSKTKPRIKPPKARGTP